MNEIARAWVAELRSGRHQQAVGALVTEQRGVRRYCCLGLAYTVMPDAVIEADPDSQRDCFECRLQSETEPNKDVLTEGGRDALGLSDTIGSFSWESLREKAPQLAKRVLESVQGKEAAFVIESSDVSLATLNDYGVAFATIADVIEAEPDGLFVTEC